MMTNKLKIDTNTDAYTTYQVYATEGVFSEVAGLPNFKTYDTNDWQEYNAIEVGSALIKLNNRTLTIPFACNGGLTKHDAFMAYLYAQLHQYTFVDLNKTLTLRVLGEKDFKMQDGLITFKVEFAEDMPLSGYVYQAPQSSLPVDNSAKFDNIPLSQYGIRLLKGTMEEVAQHGMVRENLVRNIRIKDGATSYPIPVTLKSRDIKLPCLMTTDSVAAFWRNWYAMLYNFQYSFLRTLYYAPVGSIGCMYKSCSVKNFRLSDGKVWCEFSLTLTTINNS